MQVVANSNSLPMLCLWKANDYVSIHKSVTGAQEALCTVLYGPLDDGFPRILEKNTYTH